MWVTSLVFDDADGGELDALLVAQIEVGIEKSHPGAEDDRCDVQFQFVEESELDDLAQEVPPPRHPCLPGIGARTTLARRARG
jgi:hypothetical protein